MEELLRYLKKEMLNTFLMLFRIFNIKQNRIVLLNDSGKNYAGNPKYIAEYLLEHYRGEFDIIFALGNEKEYAYLKSRGIKPVTFRSLKYFYYAMTAAVFLTNSGGISYIPFRKKQYIINTWHGGGAYKKGGIDTFGDTFLFRKDVELAARKTNLYLSTCSRFTQVTSESKLTPREIFWEIGMPRNDILLRDNQKLRKTVRERIGLLPEEKMVLFAPTFRILDDDFFKNTTVAFPFEIDYQRVRNALCRRFGEKWRFAYRLHPFVAESQELWKGDILNLSKYEEMQELLVAADVFITDYSSSMWDFMLTRKPCFIYAEDLQQYIKIPGFYTPIEELPFPISTNNDELESNILKFDENKYLADCRIHYEAMGGCETGEATKLVCEKIFQICFGRSNKNKVI